MSLTIQGAERRFQSSRRRLAGFGAAGAALAIAFTAITVPAATAISVGDWTLETELGTGNFNLSYGVAVDQGNGDFYVTDTGSNQLFKFNSKGELLTKRGGPGDGFGNFSGPHGVAVSSDGYVYVADTDNQLVQKFDKSLNWVAQWGGSGNGNGELSSPLDVAVDGSGNVFVADTLNHRIQKFAADGMWLDKWGVQGQGDLQFEQPRAVTVSQGDIVLVADTNNNRVSAFSGKGVYQGSFGSVGSDPGQFDTPADILVDAGGNILVADIGNDRIQKLNGAGAPIDAWATPSNAQGIALDAFTGRAYVADGTTAVLAYRQASAATFTAGPKTSATAGKAYSSTLKASGFPQVSGFAIVSGALPPGLKFVSHTITGVPNAPGAYKVRLRPYNSVDSNQDKDYTITVAKASSKVSASFSTKYPKLRKTNIRAKVKLSAPSTTGLSKTGKVRVYYGKKRVKTFTFRSAHKGSVRITLPKFKKKGKTRVTFRYLGNGQLKSAERAVYVRVR